MIRIVQVRQCWIYQWGVGFFTAISFAAVVADSSFTPSFLRRQESIRIAMMDPCLRRGDPLSAYAGVTPRVPVQG
jgi:hypothetical protein